MSCADSLAGLARDSRRPQPAPALGPFLMALGSAIRNPYPKSQLLKDSTFLECCLDEGRKGHWGSIAAGGRIVAASLALTGFLWGIRTGRVRVV